MLLIGCHHAMVLLAELDANLVNQTKMRQVLKFAVAIYSISYEAALFHIDALL